MTVFTTDFSEYSTGSAPSDWTLRWDAVGESTILVQDRFNTIDGPNQLRFTEDAYTSNLYPAISWDDIGSVSDVEMVCTFQIVSGRNSKVGLVARGAGLAADNTEDGYFCTMDTASYLTIKKYVSGTQTTIGYDTGCNVFDDDRWYCMRFKVEGTSLKARFWSQDEDEPETWNIDITDSDISSAGWAGVHGQFDWTTLTFSLYMNYFSAATGSDEPVSPTRNFSYSTTFTDFNYGTTGDWEYLASLSWDGEDVYDYFPLSTGVTSPNDNAYITFDSSIDPIEQSQYFTSIDFMYGSYFADQEIQSTFLFESVSTSDYAGFYLRKDSYSYICAVNSNSISIQYSPGTYGQLPESILGSAAKTIAADTWYNVRFQAIGTSLKAKVWENGTTEPSAWDVEVTDSNCVCGRIGLGAFSRVDIKYDQFVTKVGTETYINSAGIIDFEGNLPVLTMRQYDSVVYEPGNVFWGVLPTLSVEASSEFVFIDAELLLPDLQIEASVELVRGMTAELILPTLQVIAEMDQRCWFEGKLPVLKIEASMGARADELTLPTLQVEATITENIVQPVITGVAECLLPALGIEASIDTVHLTAVLTLPTLKVQAQASREMVIAFEQRLPTLSVVAECYCNSISFEGYLPTLVMKSFGSGDDYGATQSTVSQNNRFDGTLLRYDRWAI